MTLEQLITRVTKWRHDREELIASLTVTKDELQEIHKKVNICKVAGSSTCIVGGVLTIVGLALIPVTFGGSLAIAIAGGVVGGAGGITSGAPAVYEHIKQHITYSSLFETIEQDQKELRRILRRLRALYPDANAEFIIHDVLGHLFGAAQHGAGAIFRSVMVAKNGIWNMVVSPALDGASLAKTATTVGKVGLSAGSRAAGLVLSSVMLPVDIVSLALAAKDVHQNNIPNICKEIQKIITQLQEPLTKAMILAIQLTQGADQVDDYQVSSAFLTLLAHDVNPE